MICVDEKRDVIAGAVQLEMACGAKAVKTHGPNGETMQVFSQEGSLIFEYDPDSGRHRLYAPRGDLELSTGDGDILFNSGKNIRFASKQTIEMDCETIGMNADKGDFKIEKTAFSGMEFTGRVRKTKLVMERLESIAETVIDTAKNVYRSVEGLLQTRTGRMRTMIDTSWHCKSGKAFLKSEDDFKIKGEKIHLG